MNRRDTLLSWLYRGSAVALVAGGIGTSGCARGPDVAARGLPLRSVVIYRNGVGYYERAGRIDNKTVTFRVRKERIGDFLASLAVMEAGGSSVRSASFPVELDNDEAEQPVALLDPEGKPVPAPPHEKAKDPLETVRLTLDGEQHDLIVSYVAETPVWRPSYRLVVDSSHAKDTTADLQAWGIVQNLSGEDWVSVRLSLVAGAPISFRASLDRAVIPERPRVTDEGEVIASVPGSETSLDQRNMPPPAPPPTPVEAAAVAEEEGVADNAPSASSNSKGPARKPTKDAAAFKIGAGTGAGRSASMRAMAAPAMAPPAPQMAPSPPRDVRSLASVITESGTTRYELPFPVDVPNKTATMVLLTSKKVPGESIFLFAPDAGVPGSSGHPFRVARFTNTTTGLLERGPIAVYERGAFLGQGLIDPLPPGATTTVPFALERSLGVESFATEKEEGARLAQIEGGLVYVERDVVYLTKYTVKNGADGLARMMVKHSRRYGARLHEPPKGTEDNTGTMTALVPFEVSARATAALEVDERMAQRRQMDWLSPLVDEAVRAYMSDARADARLVKQLGAAWELRAKLKQSTDEQSTLMVEQRRLEQQTNELRKNLTSIAKNKTAEALRKELTDRLTKASARLDELTKKLIVVEMALNEQSIRFRDAVAALQFSKPLS